MNQSTFKYAHCCSSGVPRGNNATVLCKSQESQFGNFQNEMNSFQKQSRFLNPTKVPFLENLFERFHQKVGKLKNPEI